MIPTPMGLLEDVVRDIIDQTDDELTLKNCALLSSHFRTTSQRRLFSTIAIQLKKSTQHDRTGFAPIHKFRDVLRQNPSLATYVRVLSLRLPVAIKGMPSTYLTDEAQNASTFGVLAMLPNLQSFGLQAGQIYGIDDLSSWDLYPISLQTDVLHLLRTLKLRSFSITGLSFPHNLVHGCTSLQSLRLHRSRLEPDLNLAIESDTSNMGWELDSLDLSPPDDVPVYIGALSIHPSSLQQVRRLTFGDEIFGVTQRDACQLALDACAESLEDVEFSVLDNSRNPLLLDLTRSKKLRSVAIRFLGRTRALAAWAETFVNSAIPPLQHITFDLGFERPTPTEWALLDEVLASKAPTLQDARITLVYHVSPSRRSGTTGEMETDIPKLMGRGNIELRLLDRLEYASW